MKFMSLTVPILIVSLTVIAVWGMGMLAVKTSAISTQASLDLLRLHLRVARLHEELLEHSKKALTSHAAKLAADGGPVLHQLTEPASATSAASATPETPETPETTAELNPWPEPPEARGESLEDGLLRARPKLNRLARQLGQALPPH
ncbi:MAG TPA: hypothetical protein VFE33_11345 [Thermoanaerobaculia bacterium]|nr:hypothetical protein [Thermoanaerobaculia bacterium]